MDKKTIIGIVLMVVVFIGYSFYMSGESKKAEEIREKNIEEYNKYAAEQQALAEVQAQEAAAKQAAYDALPEEEKQRIEDEKRAAELVLQRYTYGDTLLASQSHEQKLDTLDNDYISVVFDNKGGKIVDVTLKQHTRYAREERNEPVKLIKPNTAYFGLNMRRDANAELLNTNDFIFDSSIEEVDGVNVVTMTLATDEDAYVQYIYKVYNTGDASRDYLIDFTINNHNFAQYLDNREELVLRWENQVDRNEQAYENENMSATITYYDRGEDEATEMASGGEEFHRGMSWAAFKQQYFNSALVSNTPFNGYLSYNRSFKGGADFLKEYKARIILPQTAGDQTHNLGFYYGPNDYEILSDVALDGVYTNLENVIPMGDWIIGWINRNITVHIFNWLNNYGLGLGIVILLLTILVKLIILPLTYKSYMSTAKMRVIRPEIEEINKKYPKSEDAMKKQQAMMELYRKAGVSPMGGCLPLLIQMPILWAMFRFFPSNIALRGEGFLWADDLSTYDSVIDLPGNIPFYGDHVSLFALLMAVALFGYSFYSYKQTAATTPQAGSGVMKFMMVYFMPVMMLFFFNNYSSGLCYYYFVSQVLTMIIMYVIRRTVDDAKVRARLEAYASRPRKKSKFQQRYEDMLKQHQEQLNREQRRQRR